MPQAALQVPYHPHDTLYSKLSFGPLIPHHSLQNHHQLTNKSLAIMEPTCHTCSSCPSCSQTHSCCKGSQESWCSPSTCRTCNSYPSWIRSHSRCRGRRGFWCCPSTCHTCSSCPSYSRNRSCCRGWPVAYPCVQNMQHIIHPHTQMQPIVHYRSTYQTQPLNIGDVLKATQHDRLF